MATNTYTFVYKGRRGRTDLTDVVITIKDSSGNTEATAQGMSHEAYGQYTYSFTATDTDTYYGNMSSKKDKQTQTQRVIINVVTLGATEEPLSTYLQVKYRLGDIEANIGEGSQFVVAEAISGATSYINQMTGNLTGNLVNAAVADYAAAQVVRSFLGRDNMSVSNVRTAMDKELEEAGNRRLKALGIRIRTSVVNP